MQTLKAPFETSNCSMGESCQVWIVQGSSWKLRKGKAMKRTFARKFCAALFAAAIIGGAANASAASAYRVDFINLADKVVASDVPAVELVRMARPGFRPGMTNRRNGFRQQNRRNFRAPWGKPRFIPYTGRAPNVSRDFYQKRNWSRDLKGWGNRHNGPVMKRYRGP
jgi:hypothetical protein